MIVVDASALVASLTDARYASVLGPRLALESAHAPSIVDFEVIAAVRAQVRRGLTHPVAAEQALRSFADLPLRRWNQLGSLYWRAFELSTAVSAYDASYVALAEALGCGLITCDGRLARSAGHGVQIELLRGQG